MSYHALWATASGHAIKARLDQDRLNSLIRPFWSPQTDPSIFSSITQDMSAMLLSGVINYGLNLGYILKAFSVARAMTRARATTAGAHCPPFGYHHLASGAGYSFDSRPTPGLVQAHLHGCRFTMVIGS